MRALGRRAGGGVGPHGPGMLTATAPSSSWLTGRFTCPWPSSGASSR